MNTKIVAMMMTMLCVCGLLFGHFFDQQGLLFEYTDADQDAFEVSRGEADGVHIIVPNTFTVPGTDTVIPIVKVANGGFADYTTLERIDLYNMTHLLEIGDGAFENCTSLPGTRLPASVIRLGDGAFQGCVALGAIHISSNLEYLGDEAFNGCVALSSIYHNENHQTGQPNTLPNTLTVIGDGAFANCSITNLPVPNSVVSIGDGAFAGCDRLTSLTLPDGLLAISDELFYGCHQLANFSIPIHVESIGSRSFAFCTSIDELIIPSSVTTLGDNPFAGCSDNLNISFAPGNTMYSMTGNCLIRLADSTLITGFANSDIPDFVEAIGDFAFSHTGVIGVNLPISVNKIGSSAFFGCGSLIEIELPLDLDDVGDDAFSDCASLDTVYIPNRHRDGGISRHTTLGERIFADCPVLTSVILPPSFTAITTEMFSGCASLTNITISDSIVSIGASAFANCSTLPEIQIPLSVEIVGSQAFVGCNSLTIYVEANDRPVGWAHDFNPDDRPVIWHYLSENDEVAVVAGTRLVGNYPNPFNPTTTISFDIAKDGHVAIDIYNVRGQKVRSLVNGDFTAGNHTIVWNGTDHQGRSVSSGVYFYRMTAGGYHSMQKMALLK